MLQIQNDVCCHSIQIEYVDGYIVTICQKCGKILDMKAAPPKTADWYQQKELFPTDPGIRLLHDNYEFPPELADQYASALDCDKIHIEGNINLKNFNKELLNYEKLNYENVAKSLLKNNKKLSKGKENDFYV